MAWLGAMFGVWGTSVIGATAADAPPTSEKVNPAAPNTGTAFVARFFFEACFTFGIVAPPYLVKNVSSPALYSTLGKSAMQDYWRMAHVQHVSAIHVHERYERRQRRSITSLIIRAVLNLNANPENGDPVVTRSVALRSR
jgi:hypothetical protein